MLGDQINMLGECRPGVFPSIRAIADSLVIRQLLPTCPMCVMCS